MSDVSSSVLSSASRKRKQAEAFVKGSIKRVTVQNFLTYDECTFHFNPKLNVIIGPNGTGKSSIVCAICIGLGGKTNFLARAKELGEYIKHGKTKAFVEIELQNHPKPDVIRRDICHAAGGKTTSSWSICGNTATSKQVEEIVSGHNIQLSNLCQFLPQERVADFAKMNKIELLDNTELAVCDAQMQEDHRWLKEYRALEKDMEVKHHDDKEYLEKLIQKNERLEREVKRYQERDKITTSLKFLNKKRIWLVYEEARKEFYNQRQEAKELKQLRAEAQRKVLPLMKEIDRLKTIQIDLDKENKKKAVELKSFATRTKEVYDQMHEMDEKIQEKWEDFKERQKDHRVRLKKIEQYELQISGWRTELDQLQDVNVQEQIDEVKMKIRDTVTEIASAEDEQRSIQERRHAGQRDLRGFEAKLAELRNQNEKRLEILRRKNRDCYNATVWLRNNRSKFRATVHEPIVLCIDVKDSRNAELVENHISFRDMMAFVCEDPEDNDSFIREVHGKQRLQVNVIKAPRDSNGRPLVSDMYRPRRDINQLKQWGFTSYLRELFTAPDAVMAFLCKQYKMHEIPIGSPRTKEIVEQVTKQSNLDLFFIPSVPGKQMGSRYSVKKSKYSSNTVVGSRSLRRPEFLDFKVDQDELQAIQQQIQNLKKEEHDDHIRSKELAAIRSRMEKRDNELRSAMKELQQHRNKRKTLENKIMIKMQNLKDLESTSIDLEALKRDLEKALSEITRQKRDLVVEFIKKITLCVDSSIEKGIQLLKYTQCLRRKLDAEGKVRDANLQNTELIKSCERAEESKKEAEKKAKLLYQEAIETTGELTDNLKEVFATFPDDLVELDVMRHEFKAKLDCCGLTNPEIFEEFSKRKEEIEQLQKQVDKTERKIATKRSDMVEIKTRWLKPLNQLVSRINSRFSKYFQQMGCAGEVDIHAENPDDFDKYGIRIRVKFRASSTLQELDPFRQSGGERSVSTMLYLVALQSLHACPFRLVDEINQGMDPHNERRVFDVIVKSSAKEIFSQYFLITPKLLPNLTYNRHMSVHCVYNGPHLPHHNIWKISRFIRRRRALKYEGEESDGR